MDIDHLIGLLVEDVKQVIEWIDTHGEGFLNKHVGVGRNLQKTRALQSSYEHFDKVAQNTYTNAGKLLAAAHELAQAGTSDSREMCRLANDLGGRIQQFAQKVDQRKSLLNQVADFYKDELFVSQRLDSFKELLIVIEASSLQCPDTVESAQDAIVQLDNKKKNIFSSVNRVLEQGNAILDTLKQRLTEFATTEQLSRLYLDANNPTSRPFSAGSQSSQTSSNSGSIHYAQNLGSQHLKQSSLNGGVQDYNQQILRGQMSNLHLRQHSSSSSASNQHSNQSQPSNHLVARSSHLQQQNSHGHSATNTSTTTSLHHTTPDSSGQLPNSSGNSPANSLISSLQAIESIVKRLGEDLKRTEGYFDNHRSALDLCLQLKLYEKDVLEASRQLDITIADMQNTAQKLPDIQSVESGEKLLALHDTTSKKLRELVFKIIKKGQELIESLKQPSGTIVVEKEQSAVDQITLLVDYMDQKAQEADELADCRRLHIEYSIKFRQFEVDAQQVQLWIRKGESMLVASFHIPLSLKEAEELKLSHEKFQQAFERSHASTLQFKQRAQSLIHADYFEEESINQIIAEVESVWQQLMTHAEDRFKLIKGAINFYRTSDKEREVLETLESAEKRNAKIYAEIKGYGSTCDAYHRVRLDENGEEPARAMQIALADAALAPEEIEFIAVGPSPRPAPGRCPRFRKSRLQFCDGPATRS